MDICRAGELIARCAPALLALVIAAHADAQSAPPGSAAVAWPSVPATWGTSDIKDWYAPDDSTIVIGTYAHGRFRGTFMQTCLGIRSTETIGFSTQGPYELDPSTLVVLPDGRRCALRELVPYDDATRQKEAEGK